MFYIHPIIDEIYNPYIVIKNKYTHDFFFFNFYYYYNKILKILL